MENLFNFCFEDFGFPETLPLQTLPVVEPINSSEEVMKDGKKHHLCTFPNCGKIFRFKSELSRHSVVHNAQRTFNCPHAGCYKTFKREDALKNHIRIHTGEQPFKCDFQGCEESFPTKAGLRYHMLKHNGEKTFMCSHPSCGKSFLTQAQLRQHENSINYHKKINWQVVPEVKQAATPMTKIERETTVSSPIPTPTPAVDQFFVSNPKKTKEVSLDDFFVPSLESGIEWGMQNQHEEEVEEEAVSEDLQENFERMVKVILKDNNAMKQRLDMCNTLMGLMHENNALKQKLKKATGEYEEPQFSDEKTFSFLNLSGQQNVGF